MINLLFIYVYMNLCIHGMNRLYKCNIYIIYSNMGGGAHTEDYITRK